MLHRSPNRCTVEEMFLTQRSLAQTESLCRLAASPKKLEGSLAEAADEAAEQAADSTAESEMEEEVAEQAGASASDEHADKENEQAALRKFSRKRVAQSCATAKGISQKRKRVAYEPPLDVTRAYENSSQMVRLQCISGIAQDMFNLGYLTTPCQASQNPHQ